MTRDPAALDREAFDVLVIGGGIYGLTIAYDAALRGLRVALLERRDFGSGTSFNHHKTLHGGLRYLQSFDVGRMRTSIAERRTLARIAPSLVSPLAFVMPTRRSVRHGAWALRAAFLADRAIAWDRNRGVLPSHHLPAGRVIGREELHRLFPEAHLDTATAAALWHDYRTDEGDRLTLAFGQAAAARGAVLANYVGAIEPLREDHRIGGMIARDELSGGRLAVRARVTVNAAGASAGRVMASFGVRRGFPLIKAMNLVTRRPGPLAALACPAHGGRLLVALPWQGRLIVGTSHGGSLGGPDETRVARGELDAFLVEVNEAFPWLSLTPDDVTLVHRGMVPARRRPGAPPDLLDRAEVRDHRRDGIEGAISVVGVKYTTARAVAERTVNVACQMLGRAARSRSAAQLLIEPAPSAGAPSSTPAASVERITRRHGTEAAAVLALAGERAPLACPIAGGTQVIGAEVVYAIRHEAAVTLEDVVVRRTGLGALGHPGAPAARACASIMAAELGWTAERVQDEIGALDSFYEIRG